MSKVNQEITERTAMIEPSEKNDFKPETFVNIELDVDILKNKFNSEKKSRRVTLTWNNISCELPAKTQNPILAKLPFCKKPNSAESKKIIKNVNGIAKPQQVTAIMGASGAGKTTLLNVLNFRNSYKIKLDGDIKVNGQIVTSQKSIAAISGYVQQDDLFIGSLKVKEHLVFQAMLRMDKGLSNEARLQRVEEVLNDLNLKKCENTLIGFAEKNIKGISGGEKRRLSFASEIITDPFLLFCDEPTSGLDSFMAQSIVETMKSLAKQGRTIICTIHQPSSEVFEMFDSLCLLAEGRLAYIGDLHKAYDFFAGEGFICPKNFNPADYYIRKLAVIPTEKEKSKATIKQICDAFEKCEYNEQLAVDINKSITEANQENLLNADIPLFKASFLTQMRCLLHRNVLNIARDPFQFRIQITQTILIAILFGLIYFQLKTTQQGVQNINGLLFLFITNTSFSNMFPVINLFTGELPIFLREHRNGMYKVLPYYLSKILVDLPTYTILPTVFIAITYWMSNVNDDVGKFFVCVAIIILVAQTSVSFGTFLSACAPSTNAALSLAGPFLVPMMIFSGFFLNNSSVQDYLIWLRYISWFSYANEALIINQWQDIKYIECPNDNVTRCFRSGEDVIRYLDMNTDYFTRDILLIIAILLVWRISTFFVLLLKSKRRN